MACQIRCGVAGRRGSRRQFGPRSGEWTRDVGKTHLLARSIRAGSVCINCCHMDEYLNVKSVRIKTD
jgi:hypothetical protein